MASGFIDNVPSGPATKCVAITPSDTSAYSPPFRGVYVGVTGNLAVVLANDSVAVTFVAVPAGSLLPICATKIMSTGTTAGNIVGVY